MIGQIAFHHGDDPDLVARLAPYQRKALTDMASCGTAACGLHQERCSHCGDTRMVPNTCGNRSCPHCQGSTRLKWVEDRQKEMLPGIGYFHAVFTTPPVIAALGRFWPQVVLDALLRASADAILMLTADSKFLGAEVGCVEVLHTWTRDIRWHSHVHQIITAGGWNGERWVDAKRYGVKKRQFLLPLPPLRKAFQQRFMKLLLDAYEAGKFDGNQRDNFPELASLAEFRQHLGSICRQKWCIRIEPPFGSPEVLLRYLGAYINRVAISPKRILAHDPNANNGAGSVTWTWKTNKEPNKINTKTQTGPEFLALFAQHILPPRLVRIRFRGLWATAHRKTKLNKARTWLSENRPTPPTPPPPEPETPETPNEKITCTVCGKGTYQRTVGPCPRPPYGQRRRILDRLRHHERTPKPQDHQSTL
jgi:hypothetical protein